MKGQTWQQTLERIHRKQSDWLAMATYLTSDHEVAREVLQRVYFQLCEIGNREGDLQRILNQGGDISNAYMFSALRNQAIKYARQQQAQVKIDNIFEDQLARLHKSDQDERLNKLQVERVLESLDEEINKLYWYDRQVLKIYLYEQGSIRRMAKATKISQYSLYNTITNIKNKLKTCVTKE